VKNKKYYAYGTKWNTKNNTLSEQNDMKNDIIMKKNKIKRNSANAGWLYYVL
jgi:hypothetical protein